MWTQRIKHSGREKVIIRILSSGTSWLCLRNHKARVAGVECARRGGEKFGEVVGCKHMQSPVGLGKGYDFYLK